MRTAFTDANGGYYEVDLPEGAPTPRWAQGMTQIAPLDPPAPTNAQMQVSVKEEARKIRTPLLALADGLQASALSSAAWSVAGDAAIIEAYKRGLRDVTTLNFTTDTTLEAMRTRVVAYYATLRATLPTNIKNKFKETV